MTTKLESLVAQMTLAELAQRAGLSVTQVVEMVLGPHTGTARAPSPAVGRARVGRSEASTGQRGVDTRGAAGRATYDAEVLAALRARKGKSGAAALLATVGGNPVQLRAALARLIEAGKVKSEGKARGTTYRAT